MSTAPPVYDEAYYRDYDGQRYERNIEWLGLFRHFAASIVKTLHPTKTLDAGCALGLLVEALDEQGVESHGIDISDYAISQAPERVRDRCKVQTLTEPIEGRFDLITCIEVIEHLPVSEVHDAMANLCSATDVLLLSSTPTEHEEPTHLNVQPPEYWSALLAQQGFFRDTDYDATFISPWAALYRRQVTHDLGEVVRSYDRAWWRLRDENIKVRQALLDAVDEREALGSILTSDEWDSIRSREDQGAALVALAADLRAERGDDGWASSRLRELENGNLTLRDELIAAQRRAGEASGHIAELQAELYAHVPLREAYDTLVEQRDEAQAKYREIAESSTWRLAQRLLMPLRRLRGQSDAPQS